MENEFTKESLEGILKELSVERSIFDSEDDFKFSLSCKIKETFKDAEVRLEKKFPSKEEEGKDRNNRIDIYIKTGDISIGIELKYYTAYLEFSSEKEGEITLANQGAIDFKCYDAWKDVQRLERFTEEKYIERGFSIWLTNIKNLIECERIKENSAYREFRICEGTESSSKMEWKEGASSGTTKGRTRPIELRRQYKIHWEVYNTIESNYIRKGEKNSEFKYSIVEVGGSK